MLLKDWKVMLLKSWVIGKMQRKSSLGIIGTKENFRNTITNSSAKNVSKNVLKEADMVGTPYS